MDKKINLTIRPDKSVFVETNNYKGEACINAVKELFKSFLVIDNFEFTSDYYDGEVEINSGVEVKL